MGPRLTNILEQNSSRIGTDKVNIFLYFNGNICIIYLLKTKGVNMKVSFDQLFNDNGDNSYTPKGILRVGLETAGSEVVFKAGVRSSGLDIAHYTGKDLEVRQYPDGSMEIKGVYQ